ncbi:MAG: class I SAM-dependent methyltransferase [Chloroflexi bacterium]|nr:class I SAM-dependent methyltransferase [Chloroflexota bacterium]MBU1749465.1 class I SAM-dependent methyltransferase [Chloroflexota bacterium]MBU1877457.1 class I SAM-dependent methyltransferase [Chloroflexota bacterium]
MSVSRETPPLCDYEGSRYRTEFWDPSRTYEDAVERLALRALLPPTGERLVEIGAGFGRLIGEYAGYRQVILVDPALSMLEQAREHLAADPRVILVAGSVYDLPLATATCDTTVTVRMLHHLADVPLALTEIARITRPGGAYVLEYANKRHLKAILRYLLRRQGYNPFSREPYEFVELNFDFHPAYMTDVLRQAGFAIEAGRAVSILRLGRLKQLIPAQHLARLDGWLQRPLAPLAPAPSVFLRARAADRDQCAAPASLFRCLHCRQEGPLAQVSDSLVCPHCQTGWAIRQGIYDFRVPG